MITICLFVSLVFALPFRFILKYSVLRLILIWNLKIKSAQLLSPATVTSFCLTFNGIECEFNTYESSGILKQFINFKYIRFQNF